MVDDKTILCTFSGRFEDILWSLATARELTRRKVTQTDYATMGRYASLVPLLEAQPYIRKAVALKSWTAWGSPHGDQPRVPPPQAMAEYVGRECFHLTYARMPDRPLIDFTAYQQGVTLSDPVLPFLSVPCGITSDHNLVSYGFNDTDRKIKQKVIEAFRSRFPTVKFVRVDDMPWLRAAETIASSCAFVGCRSACAVLAHGLGKPVLLCETVRWRLLPIYGCPYGREYPATVASLEKVICQ